MTLLAWLALAGAVALLLAPQRLPPASHAGAVAGAESSGARSRWRLRRRSKPRPVDLGAVAAEVATRLQAGATAESAWARTMARAGLAHSQVAELDDRGVPRALAQLAEPAPAVRGAAAMRTRLTGVRPGDAVPPEAAGALPGMLAACRLSHDLGVPAAEILQRCAHGIGEAGQAHSARAIALAGPRSTARLLGWLPAFGLIVGIGLGLDPVAVLLGGGLGSLSLLAGVLCMLAGRRWVRVLDRAAEHADGWSAGDAPGALDPAVVLDLADAGLSAGSSVPAMILGLGHALDDRDDGASAALRRAGRALLLGAPWPEAWSDAPETLSSLSEALEPAWRDGADPGPLLRQAASTVREGRSRRAQEAAARLGSRLVLPLGVCYLPAFILLGVVPVVVSAGGLVLH